MISVVITVKNDSRVFDTIEAVQNQTLDNFEIVIVDASKGEIQERLQSFSKNTDINYIHQSNQEKHTNGLNHARNLGIENSKGEIIALLDADCTPETTWLEDLLKYFENHDIVESNVTYSSKNEKNCPLDRKVENHGINYRFLGTGLAFKKEVWNEQPFRPEMKTYANQAFGLDALNNNYSYTYAQQAQIKHFSGKNTLQKIIKESIQRGALPIFQQKYSKHNRIKQTIPSWRKITYPQDKAFTATLILLLITSIKAPYISTAAITGLIMVAHFQYLHKKQEEDLDFCPIDSAKLYFLLPIKYLLTTTSIYKTQIRQIITPKNFQLK